VDYAFPLSLCLQSSGTSRYMHAVSIDETSKIWGARVAFTDSELQFRVTQNVASYLILLKACAIAVLA
jgi:hypothetical protein